MLDFSSESKVRNEIREQLATGDWWLLLPLSWRGLEVLEEVESAFYQGPANDDLHLAMGMGQGRFVAIALAAKRHMSAESLAAVLRKRVPDASIAQLRTHDVVGLGADSPQALALARTVCRWLDSRPGEAHLGKVGSVN